MTIDEAIKIFEEQAIFQFRCANFDFRDAIQLGIEALTLLENPTDPRLIYARKLLLGETEK